MFEVVVYRLKTIMGLFDNEASKACYELDTFL